MHPFLPRFYGEIQDSKYNCIVIEFIRGKTLDGYDISTLKFNEKIKIIFEIIMTIRYFRQKKLIYRDLKPDNVMIDESKNAILIDFDRLIEYESFTFESEQILDFASNFYDPEININKKFTYKSDEYSIGMMLK